MDLISKTHLRGVIDWEFLLIKKEEENYFTSVKKINKIVAPYITSEFGKEIYHLDNNYYVIEFIPLDEYYMVSIFINDKKEIIDYYFSISKGNGINECIPYHDRLYLELIYSPYENMYKVVDEDELKTSLKNKDITNKEYDLAYDIVNKLKEEIENKTNRFLNISVKKLLEKYKL